MEDHEEEMNLPISEAEKKSWTFEKVYDWINDSELYLIELVEFLTYLEEDEGFLQDILNPYFQHQNINVRILSDSSYANTFLPFMRGFERMYSSSKKYISKKLFILAYILASNIMEENELAVAKGVKYAKYILKLEKDLEILSKMNLQEPYADEVLKREMNLQEPYPDEVLKREMLYKFTGGDSDFIKSLDNI